MVARTIVCVARAFPSAKGVVGRREEADVYEAIVEEEPSHRL